MAGYSQTPLPTKLGVKPGSRVHLDGFDVEVGPRVDEPPYDVAVLFTTTHARLVERWAVLHEQVTPAGRLWVAWPKKASKVPTDLDENAVRAHGLAHGRVDVKVCAIDETWSGLAFVVRLVDR